MFDLPTIYKPTVKHGKQTIYRSMDPNPPAKDNKQRVRFLIAVAAIVALLLLHSFFPNANVWGLPQ